MTIGVDNARDLLRVHDALRKEKRGVTTPVPFTKQDVLDAVYLGACRLAVCEPEQDKFWWAMLWLIVRLEDGELKIPDTVDLNGG